MASFELRSSSGDGHIKALAKAISTASRLHKEGLIEFTSDRVRICSLTDVLLMKFIFEKDFFSEYKCDRRHRCYVALKALLMPFKSSILMAERDSLASKIRFRCYVEDGGLHNQLVFKIGANPPAATLTYRIYINDVDPLRRDQFKGINRTVQNPKASIAPMQSRKERFLLSAFNTFAPDIDQVSIRISPSEVKFIGSMSPFVMSQHKHTTEFTHKREDFSKFEFVEDVNITVPLRPLKLFLNFIETNRIQTLPKYTFEGMGQPVHFDYDAQLFRGHLISSTAIECLPVEYEDDIPLPITMGPNDSFIADENVIQPDEDDGVDEPSFVPEENEEEEYGYNSNESVGSEFLDGDLEGLNHSGTGSYQNSSIYPESIRSELTTDTPYDLEKVREVIHLDQDDPDEIENVRIQYSSDSSDED